MSGARTALLVLTPSGFLDALRNLILWRRAAKNPEALEQWNVYFSADRYLLAHKDVAEQAIDPLVHFLVRGNQELRDPSPGFSTRGYLALYPEVASARVNALLHFVLYGKREGRMAGGEAFSSFSPSRRRVGAAAALSINNEWQQKNPLLSVVIPCFNYGRFVEQAIRSVLDQTFSDLEVIVVEGGSTDESTVAEVRRLESLGLPKTRFFYRQERHLAGDNRNFGIGMACGRYVCCLDADDTLRSPYLEIAVFLAEAFGLDIVSPSVQCHGEADTLWTVPQPNFPGILKENQIATAALFRRSAWAHVGGYRDWGVGNMHIPEDWDFWIRLLGHGFRGVSIPEPLLFYRVHSGSLSRGGYPEIDSQRESLRRSNESLWSHGPATNDRRSVVNPWANLSPEADAAPGFLLVLPYITIGGAEKLFRTIVKSLIKSGRRVVVVTTHNLPGEMVDDSHSFAELTPHVYQLSRLFAQDEIRYAFLRYLIHRYAVRMMMLAGSEFVYHLLPELKREFPNLSVVDQLFNDTGHVANNSKHSEHIAATVVPSESLRESLRSDGDAAPVYVIPHGIELPDEEGPVTTELPNAARGKVLVGFFGRFSIEKAPDLFLEITRKLAVHPHLFFIMTGEGPELPAVREQIRKYNLQERLYTPGFVPEITPLMRATDIVVLPSRLDGMPLAVLEAQALGKPVVASRVGSLPVMIEDQVTGFLCEAGDVEAFGQRILQLAGDAGLRDRMRVAARQSIERKYGAGQMLKAYEQVFQSIQRRSAIARTAQGSR